MLVAACLLVATAAFAALWLSRQEPAPRATAAPATPASSAPVLLGPGRRHGGRPGAERLRAAYGLEPATVRVEHVATLRHRPLPARGTRAVRTPLALPSGR